MSERPFLSTSWYRVAKLSPRLREHAAVHRHRYRGSIWYVLHDHATGRVHRLSPASYVIVGAMDGIRTVDQLWREAGARLQEEAPSQDDLIQLLAQLNAADLLQTEATADSARAAHAGRKSQAILVAADDPQPDGNARAALASGRLLRAHAAAGQMAGQRARVCSCGSPSCFRRWSWRSRTGRRSAPSGPSALLAADNLVLMALSYCVLKTLHELGHGYALKAFGGPVHEVGVMFLVFAPVPYVDASSASEFAQQMAACGRRRRRHDRRGVSCGAGAVRLACRRGGAGPLARLQRHADCRSFDRRLQRQSAAALRRLLCPLRSAGDPEPVATGDPILGPPDREACLPDAGREGVLRHARRADLALPLCPGVVFLSRRGDAADRAVRRLGVSGRRGRDRDLGHLRRGSCCPSPRRLPR